MFSPSAGWAWLLHHQVSRTHDVRSPPNPPGWYCSCNIGGISYPLNPSSTLVLST